MANNLQYFDRGQVVIGGAPIAELETGSVEVSNGAVDVVTMGPGYAGVTKGPLMGTISARRAIPRVGINSGQDLNNAVINQLFVSAIAVCGGKKYIVTGVPKGIKRDFGVTTTAVEDFTIHGAIEVTDL